MKNKKENKTYPKTVKRILNMPTFICFNQVENQLFFHPYKLGRFKFFTFPSRKSISSLTAGSSDRSVEK